ncbi:Rdx family protein [bacterium]|nr:Rdx family protein [bacterium]
MAALLQREFGLRGQLTPGHRGEFTVWLQGQKMAEKNQNGFPSESEVLARVSQFIAAGG